MISIFAMCFAVLLKVFQMFDQGKTGFVESIKISTILNTIGHSFDEDELQALIEENDPDGNIFFFLPFCCIHIHNYLLYYYVKLLIILRKRCLNG